MGIQVNIRGPDALRAEASAPARLTAEVMAARAGGSSDHGKLLNRDAPDQHPIEAISGLPQELEERPEGGIITNSEIDALWRQIMGQ